MIHSLDTYEFDKKAFCTPHDYTHVKRFWWMFIYCKKCGIYRRLIASFLGTADALINTQTGEFYDADSNQWRAIETV